MALILNYPLADSFKSHKLSVCGFLSVPSPCIFFQVFFFLPVSMGIVDLATPWAVFFVNDCVCLGGGGGWVGNK